MEIEYKKLILIMKQEINELNLKLFDLEKTEDSIEKRKNKEIFEYRKKEIQESIILIEQYIKKVDYKEMVKKYENSIRNSKK